LARASSYSAIVPAIATLSELALLRDRRLHVAPRKLYGRQALALGA